MKKTIITLVAILFLFTLTCAAETLPVKKIVHYDYNYDDIYVLLENGTLLRGTQLDTPNPEIIATNVKEAVGGGEMMSLLHYDGRITRVKTFDRHSGRRVCDIENTIDADAKCIIGNSLYIGNDNNLYAIDGTLIYEDVEMYKSFPGRVEAFNGLLLTKDGGLYAVNYTKYDEVQSELLMKDVNDFKVSEKYCVFYKKNKELYSISFDKWSSIYMLPLRVSKQVESFDDVISEGIFCYYSIGDSVYRYRCDSEDASELSRSGVKKFQVINGRLYTIEKDNSVWVNSKKFIFPDIWKFVGGGTDFYLTKNGDLYKTFDNNKYYINYFSNVRDVIVSDSKGISQNTVFIITNDGKLYVSRGYIWKLDQPYLTSFCEKKTRVLINSEEVELETNIQIVNNRSMYPFRECLEKMGAFVMWDSANRIAIGELDGVTVEFPIDFNYYYINGEKHYMDTAAYISNGRTYIPIRFAAEALGFKVEWESNVMDNTISISR